MPVLTFNGEVLTFNGETLIFDGDESIPVPPSPAQIIPAVRWVWAVGSSNGGDFAAKPTRELTVATGRVLTRRTKGHGFAQFSIDGNHEEAHEITLRETDLWCYRNGELMFRGRIAGLNRQLDSTNHRVQFSVIDYRGMLSQAAKVTPPAPTFAGVDQAVIAWQLIQSWQALTGADWGITNGLGATSGVFRDETDIRPGTPVGEAIDRLAERDNGFEWEISELLELNRWYPLRGITNTGFPLDYGGNVCAVTQSPGVFGNAAIATGDQNTTPAAAVSADIASDQRGRWAVSQGFPTVSIQATVNDKAVWLRDESLEDESNLTLTLTPGRWSGRSDLWLGDVAEVTIGPAGIYNQQHRVSEIQMVPGDDGTETVTVSTSAVTPESQLARWLRAVDKRVGELERV